MVQFEATGGPQPRSVSRHSGRSLGQAKCGQSKSARPKTGGARRTVAGTPVPAAAPRRAGGPSGAYQAPVFGIEAQGSAGSFALPFCSNSIEMPSGERMKAMLPSRGGRLMVTPLSMRLWQSA